MLIKEGRDVRDERSRNKEGDREIFRSYEGRFLERLVRIQDPPPHP